MMRVVSNSGIFSDELLDALRGEAIADAQGGLPEAVVYYLRALEGQHLDLIASRKAQSLRDVGWKFLPEADGT